MDGRRLKLILEFIRDNRELIELIIDILKPVLLEAEQKKQDDIQKQQLQKQAQAQANQILEQIRLSLAAPQEGK